jgi:flagella basal body P-ring formation protein FlgA
VLSTGIQRLSGLLAVVSIPVPVPNRRIPPDDYQRRRFISANLPMDRSAAAVVTTTDDVMANRSAGCCRQAVAYSWRNPSSSPYHHAGDRHVDIVFSDGFLSVVLGRAL